MSTQLLTELPRIQKTGMDYNTIIQEMKNIISENPNWSNNWSEFYESEAGVMFMNLFAWLADNMNTRQDMLINEMFIGTAQDDTNKIRHLKKIGYIPKMAHSSKVPIRIVLDKVASDPIVLTKSFNSLTDSYAERPSKIFRFNDRDINGKNITWEVLNFKNGEPDYQGSISLEAGRIEYSSKKKSTDNDDGNIYAVQGKTIYEEFSTLTSDGPFFDLKEKNIAADSIQVFLKTNEKNEAINQRLPEVKSFLMSSSSTEIPYVLEMNDDRRFRIRFSNKSIGRNKKMLPAGSTIAVFYRVCDGELGNIRPNYMSPSTELIDEAGNAYAANIYNDFPAVGGSNQEQLDEAVRNGPLQITTMDRAVTPDDYNIILNNNTNILKSKTYTATNQPINFKDYYGRHINPQETFIFTMVNKNHEGVPANKYNDFPWVTSLKEPRINERYIFDKGSVNTEPKISPTFYNFKVSLNSSNEKVFNNATIIDIGKEFNEVKDSDNWKLKLSSKKIDNLFFKDIPFDILSTDAASAKLLEFNKTHKELIVEDYARFIPAESSDLTVPIDVKENRYLNFTLNDELEVKVDFFNKTLFDENISKAYLKWDNDVSSGYENYKNDPSTGAAKFRPGIIQLINQTINTAANSNVKYKYINKTSKQYAGLNKINKEDSLNTKIKNFSLQLGDHICTFESLTDLTNMNELCNFLNNCFIAGDYKIKNGETYIDGSNELKDYQAEIVSRKNTNQNQDGVVVNNTLNTYDLIIFNREQNTNVIKDGYIQVSDPIDLVEYDGLFNQLGKSNLEKPTKYVDYNYNPASILKEGESDFGRLFIRTPEKGSTQKLFFTLGINESVANNFGFKILKIIYNNNNESYKVSGERKAILADSNSISTSEKDVLVFKRNVIFENSCMFNNYDFSELYSHYKLKDENKLEIGSTYDNFFYSGTELDNKMKSKVYGILGQKTEKDKDGKEIINDDISNYDIRLTKEKTNTNSLFAISDDLGVIPNDYVELTTNEIKSTGPGTIEFDLGNKEKISINTQSVSSCSELINKIKEQVLENKHLDIKKMFDSLFSTPYDSKTKLVIRSLSKNPLKAITFYYTSDKSNESYKWLFGTNKTNPDFYNLYPKDDYSYFVIEINSDEYYYAPKNDQNLDFYFRKMVDGVSRVCDYSISSVNNGENGYTFYITKNIEGNFPDSYFYLHFINDKTLFQKTENKSLNTDDEILQGYMVKHKVSGTDIIFLQPYFRTYDIRATITYNPSYSKDEVENNVKNAINELCGLKNANISGSMSKSKIYRAISNCSGVIDSYVSYFGFDASGEAEDSSNKEVIDSDFFEICLLHETEGNNKGLQLTMIELN